MKQKEEEWEYDPVGYWDDKRKAIIENYTGDHRGIDPIAFMVYSCLATGAPMEYMIKILTFRIKLHIKLHFRRRIFGLLPNIGGN